MTAATGTPPEAETRRMGSPCLPSNRMTPPLPHEPSAPEGTSQMVCGGAPVSPTFCSLPCAMKPMKRLSGDQKGRYCAPSVPGRTWALSASMGRTQIWGDPPFSAAEKATILPSGETRGAPTRVRSDGGDIWNRTWSGGLGALSTNPTAKAAAASRSRADTVHAIRSRLLRRRTTTAGAPAREPPSATHSSWSLTSFADWKRSSGSLARQVRTNRSRAGGVMG